MIFFDARHYVRPRMQSWKGGHLDIRQAIHLTLLTAATQPPHVISTLSVTSVILQQLQRGDADRKERKEKRQGDL